MRLVVHGGAGGTPEDPDRRQRALDAAAEAGAARARPADGVETALRALESDPQFNAGVGGAIQSDGIVRTDAGLMCSDREAGAVASLAGVDHAVSVARLVASETPHVLLSGESAVEFAHAFDVEAGTDLTTETTRARFEAADPPEGTPREHLAWIRERFGKREGASGDGEASGNDGGHATDVADHDTVGAVARDGDAFAAATSTAGRWFALAGRVGDVPQLGSGFYAAPAGGASATGAGEDIARVTLSRRAVRHLEGGADAQRAADRAIAEFGELTGSEAGLIVLDDGGVGVAFNTDAMQTAVARDPE
jgi:beta-aspartyl-peptidase (threonine type)